MSDGLANIILFRFSLLHFLHFPHSGAKAEKAPNVRKVQKMQLTYTIIYTSSHRCRA